MSSHSSLAPSGHTDVLCVVFVSSSVAMEKKYSDKNDLRERERDLIDSEFQVTVPSREVKGMRT